MLISTAAMPVDKPAVQNTPTVQRWSSRKGHETLQPTVNKGMQSSLLMEDLQNTLQLTNIAMQNPHLSWVSYHQNDGFSSFMLLFSSFVGQNNSNCTIRKLRMYCPIQGKNLILEASIDMNR